MNESCAMKRLGEFNIEIIGGQIMSRVTVKDPENEGVVDIRKVVIPKSIGAGGKIDPNEMPEEQLKVLADKKRLTEVGDIVMKLSTPYDAGRIEENSVGCIVPSFCAIIKPSDEIDMSYLLAFLNSDTCKEMLREQVKGSIIAMLSVGKIKNVKIPVPPTEKQREIGRSFLEVQRKLGIIEQIITLEQKKNDIFFRELSERI